MRILHLTWEYPPVMYGGLGRHVYALADAQAAAGHEVVVITQAPNSAAPARMAWGSASAVRVLRATVDHSQHDPSDLLAHVAEMECEFTGHGNRLIPDWRPDVLHAHDWMVAHAAVALRARFGMPLTATIHATEAGRNMGWISTPLSTVIHGIEWWLANTADSVIACSATMRDEVADLFGVPDAQVVPNGIDPAGWVAAESEVARIRAENTDAAPLIAYTGRVEWEKGVQTLVAAMPGLRAVHPGIRLLVAGHGSYLDDVRGQAAHLGLGDSVRFLGWVSEADLRAVVVAADLVVAPSLYEPFGLVALEGAILGTPLVLAGTGGLEEFAAGDQLALTFTAGSPGNLEHVVLRTLADPEAARARARLAELTVRSQFTWASVAHRTTEVYLAAAENLGADAADPRRLTAQARHALVPPHFEAPPGMLMDVGQ